MKPSDDIREGFDEYGKFWEEKRGGGWRKFKREVNGIQFFTVGSKTDDYVNALDAHEYHLRLNTMSDRIEIKDRGPITDIQESVIIGRIMDCDMKGEAAIRRSLQVSANRNKYHPIHEYLESLTWDGKDHFTALMNKLTMTSDLAEVFWRKFLIGSVAKAIHAQQNIMLVLVGAQGKGKSRLVNWLCPLKHLYNEGPVSPDNKDDLLMLINTWLWEVAELDSTTRRADRSALKHFISLKQIKVRVPYGRYPIDKPAAASMIGTVNPDGTGFLSDASGNRRFAVVEIQDISWDYEKIDVNQLWAQIYAAYKNGEAFELTRQEQEIQNNANMEHTLVTPLEDLLCQYFEIDSSQPDKFMSSTDILEHLADVGLKGDQFKNAMALAGVMTKLGIEKHQKRVGGKVTRGYKGIWIESEIVNLGSLGKGK